ncbi:MAG: glycosyltransferase family 39 protein [Rhizobacter sp.]|nr:glycosyltransferase family 39 protein [Rhizobacter sp.]
MLPDEGRYVGVAWEMLRSGDWLTPTLDGLPYFHKPPLFYWITAGSLSVFGLHEWAARAAPLVGGWLAACSLYVFLRRWSEARTARLALGALLVQPLFYGGSQFANLDMLVAGCITATTLALADAALCQEAGRPHRVALGAAYALAAAGVLAKGLIGFVLPALVVGAWLVVRGRWRGLLRLLWGPGLVLFALLALPWFVAMQRRFPGFLDYFFIVQQVKRYAEGGFNNPQPFWFYAAVLLLFHLPWLPWLVRVARRGFFGDPARGAIRLLMGLWVLVLLLFFSMPASKLVGYILPAVPPLAALIAEGHGAGHAPSARRRWGFALAAGLAGVLCVGAIVAIAVRDHGVSRRVAAALVAEPQAPVYLLHRYDFDLPFYARLREPVPVVDDWASPDIARRDNWRKELLDAGAFDRTRAAATLLLPAALPQALCRAPVSWVVGQPGDVAAYPFLAQAQAVFSAPGTQLWRVEPAQIKALACAGTPNDGSAHR